MSASLPPPARPRRPAARVAAWLLALGVALCGAAQAAPANKAASPALADADPAWAGELVLSAMNFLGVRYKHGGESVEQGFDCSGFTRFVFETSVGLELPRLARQQAHAPSLRPVARSDLQPGDLVFFNTLRRAFSHVGIYIGDGRFIHAPRTGARVRVESMVSRYWTRRFNGARRASEPPQAAAFAAVAPGKPAAAALVIYTEAWGAAVATPARTASPGAIATSTARVAPQPAFAANAQALTATAFVPPTPLP